ncbi:MAG: helix-turn-helix transcriptional regulator [Desulfobacteraceae bacterium]|nr:helix-turn-helix transcriptional regulator [Desulfobacteraceae bacterium]
MPADIPGSASCPEAETDKNDHKTCDATQVDLGTGITLHIKNMIFQEDHAERFESQAAMASFWFCLSGIEKNTIQGIRDDLVLSRGSSGIFMGNRDFKGKAFFPAKTPFQIVSIHMAPSSLVDILGRGYAMLPQPCRQMTEGKNSVCFFRSMPMTPMIRLSLEQIRNCPFGEGSMQLYYEGKAMELIACLLENLKSQAPLKQRLCASDIERIHHARELLINDIVHPPGLMELAHSVGMHHSKLNRGFKQVFGNTVFGYLRETRLQKAMELLSQGGMNSAEVSFSVGYSSLSHFAKAFKEQFHASPSSFIRRT